MTSLHSLATEERSHQDEVIRHKLLALSCTLARRARTSLTVRRATSATDSLA